MKTRLAPNQRTTRGPAFTFVEVMIAATTLVLVLTAMISINLWGLAMTQRSSIWLLSTDDARRAMGMLHEDIRTAGTIYVGSGNLTGFTNANVSNLQAGNALKIIPSTNASAWCIYYYDAASSSLYRTNWDGTAVGDFRLVSANPITNDNNIFTLQDYLGNNLSNATPAAIVNVYLSFTKLQNPQIVIEPGSPVDFYQINSKVAPRWW